MDIAKIIQQATSLLPQVQSFAGVFLGGLLSGGIGGILVNRWFIARAEKRQRKLEFIKRQLQDLYGPLYFLTSQNSRLFGLARQIHKAYQEEYVDKQYSQEELAQERVTQGAEKAIEISNQYIQQTKEYNRRIQDLLRKNYHLVDPDDIELLSEHLTDFTRMETAVDESGLQMPMEIYKHLGGISFMRPQFIELIEKRFLAKQQERKELLGLD